MKRIKSVIPIVLFALCGIKAFSQVWANNGEDKVTRDELRAAASSSAVINSVWDGSRINLFGARNEVVNFNLVIEAPAGALPDVLVQFDQLAGPGGASISSRSASGDGLFDWTGRNIELFYVRYLQIKGLSRLGYENYYDERHVPERLRRPHVGRFANAGTGWVDRPDHDKYYPDIAVPLELHSPFDVSAGTNQSIWCDIYIPETAAAGTYSGIIAITVNGAPAWQVPVDLHVRNFTLPDLPSSKTMLVMGTSDVNERYLNRQWIEPGDPLFPRSMQIIDRHFQMAHRHKISLIGADGGTIDRMNDGWTSRLNGSLFTAANGYDGPGVGLGNNVYSIGTYGSWTSDWDPTSEAAMRTNTDAWVNWFDGQAFSTPSEYFLYLIDESDDYAQQEQWAQWINNNPGPGSRLLSLATISAPTALANVPSLDIPCSPSAIGITDVWQGAVDQVLGDSSKRLFFYNGSRPVSGIFMTEEDGVGLRMIPWGQYKKGIQRWFYWESTYYVNFQAYGYSDLRARANLFRQAQTFGYFSATDSVQGETGWNYSNGDGVMFYPGADALYPADSYGLNGPIASLRLKYWRRGIQDVDYITLAKAINPTRTAQIVDEMVPKFLWEFGVESVDDPTYVYTDISWSTDPDVWEAARRELADIIDAGLAATLTLTSPNGGENWNSGAVHDITWSTTGTIANVNIDYSIDSGSSWAPVASGTANDGSHGWTVPATVSANCLVRVGDADGDPSDASDRVFSISSSAVETISTPGQPTGAASGAAAASYSYSSGGSASNMGHTLQYKIDWDDGSTSGWLAAGTTTASHSWTAAGTYHVRTMARCAAHSTIESLWSTTLAVIIYDGDASGLYNSPAQYKVLPEVIWAQAAGGGTWVSEVQLTDVTGGSQVSIYYNTATGRRGPFLLWNNSGGALSSSKFDNLLQTIDGLDTGTFTYNGTVGAVEFITQDGNHTIQAAARTVNGSYAKTFTALSLHDANTADPSRAMIIPNLVNNATYRSSCGFFNPTDSAVTIDLKLMDATNTQVGTTITKTFAAHEFIAYAIFTEAGVPYPGNSYDDIVLTVEPTSGTGKVVCFGASANNTSNDPAAHVAVQNGSSYDNGPSSLQVMPEAVWASASGGGTWVTEVQIVDMTGSSQVSVYFNYIGGVRRGPFTLWTGTAAGSKVKYANILQQLGTLDGIYIYYGKGGAVEFATQDGSHNIQVTARTVNGNYAKTFPGLNVVNAETADTSRAMLIQNYTNNVTYRSTCGFYNPTADSITVEYTLLNGSGAQVGSSFSKTLVGHDFVAFSPFAEAGVPYPGSSYDNVILRVRPTSGTGQVICFGASANNTSNDPASHLAVQGE